MQLIQFGEFALNSGLKSDWKVEADAFIEANASALAALIRRVVGPFSHCEGVPRGGLRLAQELSQFYDRSLSNTLLIVDDVLTTGGSMKRLREQRSAEDCHIVGAVVFARGPCPSWVTPLFQMPQSLWLK